MAGEQVMEEVKLLEESTGIWRSEQSPIWTEKDMANDWEKVTKLFLSE